MLVTASRLARDVLWLAALLSLKLDPPPVDSWLKISTNRKCNYYFGTQNILIILTEKTKCWLCHGMGMPRDWVCTDPLRWIVTPRHLSVRNLSILDIPVFLEKNFAISGELIRLSFLLLKLPNLQATLHSPIHPSHGPSYGPSCKHLSSFIRTCLSGMPIGHLKV